MADTTPSSPPAAPATPAATTAAAQPATPASPPTEPTTTTTPTTATAPTTATEPAPTTEPATAIEPATTAEPEALEADDASTTDGSSIDERISSYTASLASSVVDYPREYGRRYHAFRKGAYVLPNDDLEMERLDVTHTMVARALGERLYLAPVDKEKVQRILDVGTGTGIWAVEVAEEFPNAEVIGNDLSAIQPTWVPPNVKFEIDDVESSWVNNKKYDFIFVRHMLVSIADWPKLVKNVYDNLNPGGWAEFQDMDGQYYSDDGSYTEDHETRKWNKQFVEACEEMGRTSRPGPQLEGWIRDAGFENVKHERFKCPMGPWPRDPHFQDIGMLNLIQLLDGLEGFTLKLFCGYLGQTREEVLVMLAKVRQELKGNAFHAIFDHHVVYAQKPEDAEDESD